MREGFFSIQASIVLNGKNVNGTAEFDTNVVTFFNETGTLFYKEVNWKDIKFEVSEERVQTFLFLRKTIIKLVLWENQSAFPPIIISKEQKDELIKRLNQLCRDAQERNAEEERQRKLEEERLRKAEEERQRKLEEERLRKAEEERQRKLEEERQRKAEEERQRKLEEERLRKAEEERQRQLEEERLRKAEEERRRKLEEELLRKIEEERQRKLEEERLRKAEEERQRKFEEERRRKAEEERQLKLEEERLRKAEEERQRKLEEERRRKAEEECQRKLEEERLRKAEEERQRKLEEKRRRRAEEERQRKLEEEHLRKAEKERQRKLEEERLRKVEEDRQRKLEDECQRKAEEERQRKFEEERLRKIEEKRIQRLEWNRMRKAEKERRWKLEEERLGKFEEKHRQRFEWDRMRETEKERQRKLEEEHQRKVEKERQRRLEEERQRKADKERKQRIEEERLQKAEKERLLKAEEERKRRIEEERLRKVEKERLRKHEERGFMHEQENPFFVVNQHEQTKDIEDYRNCNHSIQDTLEYPECNEFQYFINSFVCGSRDARVEILAEYLMTFLVAYNDTRIGKSSKIDLEDKYSELVISLNQLGAVFGYESIIEDIVTNAIESDYYDPSALRQSLENTIIDYSYTLWVSSGEYLLDYSDSYGLKYVTKSNAYYIEKSDIYDTNNLDEIIEEKERRELFSHLARIQQDQIERIRSFIENQKKPISKDFLKVEFAECSNATINAALNHPGILHYGKHILSVNNLNIGSSEKEKLKASIRKTLGKSDRIIHVKVLYDSIYMEYYDLFMRLFIDNEDHLFAVINFLFGTEFSFNNPFLAQKGTYIPSPEERLRQYAFKNEELDVDDYLEYSRDNYIKINGILNSINLLNSRMVLKNRTRLISIDITGISLSVVNTIENLIFQELDEEDVTALRDLNCISKFPAINIPWDEWFIYSVLNKWGSKLFLYTTTPQFRSSIPVVSKNSFVTAEELQIIANKHSGDIDRVLTSSIDDLDNLDELIEESIDFDDIDDLDDIELSLSDYDEELFQ